MSSFCGHGNNLINENNFEALNNLLSQILCELSLTCRKKQFVITIDIFKLVDAIVAYMRMSQIKILSYQVKNVRDKVAFHAKHIYCLKDLKYSC